MANEKKGAIERFAESAFMKKLQVGSQKLASNEIFSTISGGMGATMGLIMIGAVIQIVCAWRNVRLGYFQCILSGILYAL